MMRPPPTSVWVMKAVAAAAKTSSQPAIAPGSVSGRTTVKKTRNRPAPSPSAAFIRLPIEPQQTVDDRKRHQRKLDLRQRDHQPVPGVQEPRRRFPEARAPASSN